MSFPRKRESIEPILNYEFKLNQTLLRSLSVFFLLIFSTPLLALTPPNHDVKTYDQLLKAIRQTRAASEQRIQAAIQSEKIREAWEIGQLIDEHFLLRKERQTRGEKVYINLAKDLNMSDRELRYMVELAREYPAPPRTQLTWGHYQTLLGIDDRKLRQELEALADKENWPVHKLREEIRTRKALSSSPNGSGGDQAPKELKPGILHTYKIFEHKNVTKIDLGFDTSIDLPKQYKINVKAGDIVTLEGKKPKPAQPSDLYTYEASVDHVVDGDTFWAHIDLGFGVTLYQRLRLRRLDAPELITTEGQKAKKILENVLNRASGPILLKVSKSDDQYGRYLVDIWINTKNIAQSLLDSGLFQLRGDE